MLEGRRATSSGTTGNPTNKSFSNATSTNGNERGTLGNARGSTSHISGTRLGCSGAAGVKMSSGHSHAIREPNKSASSTGVGMYSKDYNTTVAYGDQRGKHTGVGSGQTHKGTSHSMNNGHAHTHHSSNVGSQSSTLNKSLENVIRKAANKGVEPLRRRYTQNNPSQAISG